MTKQTEAMKLALEAWQTSSYGQPSHHKAMVLVMTALRQALANEALERMAENARELGLDYDVKSDHRLMEQPAHVQVPVKDNTYGYAKSLAEAIFKQHFASDEHYASGRIVWDVNDTVIGILTQIDNMVADMVRRPEQQEPVMVNMQPPATQRDRWMYEQGRLAERDSRTHTDRAYELAEKVRTDLDRQSCPGVFMNIAVDSVVKHYTRPQAREPLTDEQIMDAVREADLDWHQGWTLDDDAPNRFTTLARAIEAAHGIGENK